ncbi:MAG: TraB/GumN family protein [Porphyrobacter sp.]|nr:TraB/GumN family protein [Porphyrobacter sp.]
MRDKAGATIWRQFAAVIALLLNITLVGCSDAPDKTAADGPRPTPLLYEIASADGTIEGWMLGTIHALPPDTAWRTPTITGTIEQADLLVVEIAALDDGRALSQTFAALSASPDLPTLGERVTPDLAAPLASLVSRGDFAPDTFASMETWAAALTLARVDASGDPANGVDRALIAEFAGRPIRELEGAAGQLSIFDRLPEAQQRAMLAAVVRESEAARKDPERLQRAWLSGDAETIEVSTREGILTDPGLREALLVGRNRRWAAALVSLLDQPPRPLIAVGTAHLVGPDGLTELLKAEGYRIRRLSPP